MRVLSWFVLAVLLSPAPAQSVARLVADLNTKKGGVDTRAYRTLYKELPEKAIPHMVRELPGFTFRGQSYGMQVLARYRPKSRRPALRRLVKCEVPFLVGCSAAILLREGDRKALPPLLGALRSERMSAGVRATMVKRLDGIEDPEVLTAIRELLIPGVSYSLLTAVLSSMWATRDPAGIPAVQKLLATKATRGASRGLCAAFLVALDRPEPSATLGKAVSSPSAISSIIWTYLGRARKLQPVVLHGLADHARKTKNAASLSRALRTLEAREYRDLVRVLRDVAGRKTEKLAKVAFKMLAEMPDLLKRAELAQLLQSDKPWLALFAVETLRRRDDDSGLPCALALVAREDKPMDKYRVDAIRVLGGFRHAEAVQPLIDHLGHPVAAVRSRAYSGVQSVLGDLYPYSRFDFRTTGYQPGAKLEQRRAGIAKIQAWWNENKD